MKKRRPNLLPLWSVCLVLFLPAVSLSVSSCQDYGGGSCKPDCTDLECGPDPVCGESCGECTGGGVCQAGACVCASHTSKACRDGDVWWLDSCGEPEELSEDCDWGCQNAECTECIPDCAEKECGGDGCGGSCGTCSGGKVCQDGSCVCEPRSYRDCHLGDVWWFNSCGQAEELVVECEHGCRDGLCIECTPACDGKECGPDGCGADCGTCGALEVCDDGICVCIFFECDGECCAESDICYEGTCCAPDCAVKECGSDGCGGSCGSCDAGETCHDGNCCTPDCSGKECGSDGCGGSCGTCEELEECSDDHTCQCAFVECEGVCCTEGQVCSEGACCDPACDSVVCGTEPGCGSDCGPCNWDDPVDWRQNGGNNAHTRLNPSPIEPQNLTYSLTVPILVRAWGRCDFQYEPVVASGAIFGWILDSNDRLRVGAFSLQDGHKIWESEEAFSGGSTPIGLHDGKIYLCNEVFSTDITTCYALDATNGKQIWEHVLENDIDDRNHIGVGPMFKDGLVYQIAYPGALHVFDPDTGDEIDAYYTWGSDQSFPTAAGETVVLSACCIVQGLVLDSHENDWLYQGDCFGAGGPQAAYNGSLVFVVDDCLGLDPMEAGIHAYDPWGGLAWVVEVYDDSTPLYPPAVDNDFLYLNRLDHLLLFDVDTGEIEHDVDLSSDTSYIGGWGAVTVANVHAYVPVRWHTGGPFSLERKIVAVDLSSFEVVREWENAHGCIVAANSLFLFKVTDDLEDTQYVEIWK